MEYKNKILTMPNGKTYHCLSGKAIDDGKKSVYLFLTGARTEPEFSLWYCEAVDDQKTAIWPYEEADKEDLTRELEAKYLETAFDKE